MTEYSVNRFILNNSLAAISAVRQADRILSTDGSNCGIHIFDSDGSFRCFTETFRPYRRLREDIQGGMLTALGCCNQARIYFIDENFDEVGYTELDTAQDCGCGCNCGCDDLSEITDAMSLCIGSERFFIGSFRKSAYLFDSDGKRMTKLCSAERNETLTDFISFGTERYAFSTLNGDTRTVTVSEGGVTQSAILARGYTLRMLFAECDRVYGLFGRNYIYNRIIPIYTDGRLTLPQGIEKTFCSC